MHLIVITIIAVGMLHLFWYIFAHEFLFNLHFDLEPDYIIRKGIWPRIQRYTVRTEILSTFTHESNAFFSIMSPIETNACPDAENATNHARNRPFPLRYVDFHLTHVCLSLVVSFVSIVSFEFGGLFLATGAALRLQMHFPSGNGVWQVEI